MRESKLWHLFVLTLWRVATLACVLIVLAAFLIAFPNLVLKPLLLYTVNARIPGHLEIDSLSWTLDSFKAKGIVYLGDQATTPLTAKKITVNFTLQDDYVPHLDLARIENLDLPAIYDPDQGFVIEGGPSFEESEGASEMDFQLPPFEFTKGQIRFQTDQGEVTLLFNGSVSYMDQNLALKGNGEVSAQFISLKGDVDITGEIPSLKGNFTLNQFIVPQLLVLPIQGKGNFSTSPQDISIQGEFSNAKLGLKFKTNTLHNIEKKRSTVKVDFTIPNLKAALDASTTKIPNLPAIQGGISGKGDFTYQDEKMSGGVEVRLKNISVSDEDYKAENITGTLKFTDLDTFSTPSNQQIRIQKLATFLPLRQVEVTFKHKGNGEFFIHKARAALEKGTLSTSSFPFESFDAGFAFTLYMKGVSAQYLASFSKLSNLDVTGLVDGQMDLEVHDMDFGIKKGGKLWISNPPGVIQYRPDLSQTLQHNLEQLTGNENPMDLALIALWNMHYTELDMDLDKKINEELNATLHLKGKNPDAFSAHPFEFNINVSGETLRLIREALASIE